MSSAATVKHQSTVVSSVKGLLWRLTSQIVWTLSPRAERLKDTLPESSHDGVNMARSAWIAEWSGRCKSICTWQLQLLPTELKAQLTLQMKSDPILPVVLTGLLAQLTTAWTVITKVPRKGTIGSLPKLWVSMEHHLSWLSCFSGLLICFVDPRVRKIRNEASNCPGIFSRTLHF